MSYLHSLCLFVYCGVKHICLVCFLLACPVLLSVSHIVIFFFRFSCTPYVAIFSGLTSFDVCVCVCVCVCVQLIFQLGRVPESIHGIQLGSCWLILIFCEVFCRSLLFCFVLSCVFLHLFLFLPLFIRHFFDLRLLITPLVSSIFSITIWISEYETGNKHLQIL